MQVLLTRIFHGDVTYLARDIGETRKYLPIVRSQEEDFIDLSHRLSDIHL